MSVFEKYQLKNLVGQEIKSYAHAKNIKSPVKEGRRCWTLDYVDVVQFHIDILPAIPDGEAFKQLIKSSDYPLSNWTDTAIAITDKTHPNYRRIHPDWPCSNPRGYAEWFSSCMQAIRQTLIERQVEDVPDYAIKTPLQQSVQILKRHRDIWFEKNKFRYGEKAEPISIIITTLTALAYNNEIDLQQALWNIVTDMPNHIKCDINGVVCISNPVNPLENFADKWQEHPIRKTCFMDWLKQVQEDFRKAFESGDIQNVGELLKHCLGESVVNKAQKKLSDSKIVHVSPLVASVKPQKQYAEEKASDPGISVMELTDDEVKWLESNFPALQYEPSFSKITGDLRFWAVYDNVTGKVEIGEQARELVGFINDTFEIEIRLDSIDRYGWPKVYEIGGRHYRIAKENNVPIKDLHFYTDDDSCCLGLKYGGNRNLRIKDFLIELVIPFFYHLSYTAEFGIDASRKLLWDEYSHGDRGHIEHFNFIMDIAKCNPGRNSLCPCDSGKKYKKCHMDEVEFLKRGKTTITSVQQHV